MLVKAANVDVLCLQEVDHFEDFYSPLLGSVGYEARYFQRPGRRDGVVVAWRRDAGLTMTHVEEVRFDDLRHAPGDVLAAVGLVDPERLLKSNVALITRFSTASGADVSVATTHLHWNPAFPELKLAQMLYLLERVASLRAQYSIVTGDLNSFPGSEVIRLVEGGIDVVDSREVVIGEEGAIKQAALQRTFDGLLRRRRSRETQGEVKFLCDASLSRLARWLRLLGVDASLETAMQAKDLTTVFDKARLENRVILTTSTTCIQRRTCPAYFLVPTTGGQEALEKTLISIIHKFRVSVTRKRLLSVCGKCGGLTEP